ncbi:chromosome segregation protein SMC [Sediminitomix flava]|uniref:Chromosome partition protein Smc n=1 Tax=Sediminitomix flava TaxID=379075 RepID=A0A315Z4T2_SEDFL|nr:chromosome segregation protein SMC [Sediminitomix flava]PWJ38493.1 condensin subunit Smc [Sediminitomix flava]
MLLNKLEIKGFKSFGDRVTLNFDEGVTAVVGPNGSGKSNVVDAIRWVLGEQSTKALRSEKMDNIIFNGTKKRRPLNMAEVSLTFKNHKNLLPTEYSEVTIGRRFYRSGDGEYLLNGVSCRLKDIQNLFLDTGIGSNSYAIIELKMVDEILNDINNSRRNLFEEAAGISKFKKRKKETLKKLADTDADLERVDDLLHEIEKNMRSLERQAREARRYLKLKKEYKQISISYAKKSVSSQLDQLEEFADRIQQEKTLKENFNKLAEEKELQLKNEKEGVEDKEKLVDSRRKTLNEHLMKIHEVEGDKKLKAEKGRFLDEKKQALFQNLDEEQASINSMKASLDKLKVESEVVQKMIAETEYLLVEYKTSFESQKERVEGLKRQSTDLEVQIKNRQTTLFQLRKSLEVNELQLTALKQELEQEHQNSSEKSNNLQEFDEALNTIQKEETELRLELEQVKEQQQLNDSKKALLEGQEKTIKDEVAELNRTLDAKQNEYDLTKSMVDNLEGFPEAIKFIRKRTSWGQKAPLLSDLITSEEKYRTAIENYLEPYLNFFILEDEDHAWKSIELLTNNGKGRANFLLLSKFSGYKPLPKKEFEDAFPVIDIVQYDEKHRDLVNFMLDNLYMLKGDVEDLPADDSAIFISENGKFIKKKFIISGGSVGVFEGKKIGRSKNLENLAQEIEELKLQISAKKEALENIKIELEILLDQDKKELLTELTDKYHVVSQELTKIQTKREQFISFLSDAEHKREAMQEKIVSLQEALENDRPRLEDETYTLEDLENRFEDIKDELQKEQELLSQKSAQYNEQNILFHQQENKIQSLENELNFKASTYSKGSERLQAIHDELKKVEEELQRISNMDVAGDQVIQGLYEEKEAIEEAVKEAEKTFYASRGNINDLEIELRDYQRKKETTDNVIMQLSEKIQNIRLDLTSVKEKISAEFNLDLEKLANEEDEDNPFEEMAESELRPLVAQTKEKLSKIGPVNHMAIEAFDEVKERHTFITTQKDDLLKAKEQLAQTISDIDTVARERFMESFDLVRDNFIEVFRSLFTEEDNCDLRLVDPDDPLNSKIAIMAQPKGKRPLTINQLSGGEKTLTATALLFSIYLLKPAPFCIFDEVDAPLDDANVDKFNKIIRKFSENSQFIIITHNKRTMTSTEVIYGVTMIEQGVTSVVPVDIRNIPELKLT